MSAKSKRKTFDDIDKGHKPEKKIKTLACVRVVFGRVQEALPGECEMYALSRAFLEEETKELLWDTEDLEIAITYFEKFVGSGNMCSGGIIVFEAV